jgi:hypothetical protein
MKITQEERESILILLPNTLRASCNDYCIALYCLCALAHARVEPIFRIK